MQRFIGLVMIIAGGTAVLWGGYHCLAGESTARITVTNDLHLSAMVTGLIGLAVCTIGFVWNRD